MIYTREEMPKYKRLILKRHGWKRIAKNTMKFGWELYDAKEHTTVTEETSYTGKVVDDTIYLDPHTKTYTSISIHLSFVRYKEKFSNLFAIFPLEILYKIVFTLRRILGSILPLAFGASFLFYIFMSGTDSNVMLPLGCCFIGLIVWAVLILFEQIFAGIAGKILRFK